MFYFLNSCSISMCHIGINFSQLNLNLFECCRRRINVVLCRVGTDQVLSYKIASSRVELSVMSSFTYQVRSIQVGSVWFEYVRVFEFNSFGSSLLEMFGSSFDFCSSASAREDTLRQGD